MRGIILSLLFAAGASLASTLPDSGPRIDVDATRYSFGRVPDDRAVEHVFVVRNRGNKPLIISRVRSSCGCAAAMMESSVIAPGEAGKLRVSFNARRQKGRVTRSVSIHSNDADNPVVSISITADVVPADEDAEKKETPPRVHEIREKLTFDSACLRCHGPKKKSQVGSELYESACAACHGVDGKGRKIDGKEVGSSLELARRSVKSKEGLMQLICVGSGNPSMPGFGEDYGGPLSEEQIESLVDLILKGIPRE